MYHNTQAFVRLNATVQHTGLAHTGRKCRDDSRVNWRAEDNHARHLFWFSSFKRSLYLMPVSMCCHCQLL